MVPIAPQVHLRREQRLHEPLPGIPQWPVCVCIREIAVQQHEIGFFLRKDKPVGVKVLSRLLVGYRAGEKNYQLGEEEEDWSGILTKTPQLEIMLTSGRG